MTLILIQFMSLVFFSLTVLFFIYVRLKNIWLTNVINLTSKWIDDKRLDLFIKYPFYELVKPSFKNWFYLKKFDEENYK